MYTCIQYIYTYYIYTCNVCEIASFWGIFFFGGPSSATSAFIPLPAVQEFNETFYMPIPQAAKGREMETRDDLKRPPCPANLILFETS